MERVEVLKAYNSTTKLQDTINEWLEKMPDIEITRTNLTAAGTESKYLVVTIFYKPKKYRKGRPRPNADQEEKD